MNHQPFEDWLLEDEPLTIQQEREMQIHIRSCTSCAAIADSNLALHTSRLIAPARGFTDRFKPRLAGWRLEQRRRQAIGTIVLVLAGLAVLYAVAGPSMLQAIHSPAAWLTEVTGYVIMLSTFFSVIGKLGSILLRSLPGAIPPVVWWGLLLVACGMGMVWITTMRRLARASQGA